LGLLVGFLVFKNAVVLLLTIAGAIEVARTLGTLDGKEGTKG
jgi:hypothetical protein